jgi:integrase
VTFRLRYTGWRAKRDDQPRKWAQKWLVFGEYPALTLAEAHKRHLAAQEDLEHGLDPADEWERRENERQRLDAERAESGTVADLVEQFVHRRLRGQRWDAEQRAWIRDAKMKTKLRKRPEAAEALLKSNLVEAAIDGQNVGRMSARDLTKRQLVKLLDGIVDRGAPVTANRVHALLKQMLDWATAKDVIPASPMAGIERPGGDESPRERVLTVDEIKAFWSKIDTADMAKPTRLALKLLLVTAQRRGELTFAKWSNFDLERACLDPDKKASVPDPLWTIPVALLKTSHSRRSSPEPHVVPLSPLAVELLRELHALTGEGAYVLPARADKKKDRSYSERVLSRAVRENEDHFGIPHWTPHDLRRTAASFMTKLSVPRLHVEKVLNHSTGDIAEVYDRHDYLAEKRAALEKWAEHLATLLKARATQDDARPDSPNG